VHTHVVLLPLPAPLLLRAAQRALCLLDTPQRLWRRAGRTNVLQRSLPLVQSALHPAAPLAELGEPEVLRLLRTAAPHGRLALLAQLTLQLANQPPQPAHLASLRLARALRCHPLSLPIEQPLQRLILEGLRLEPLLQLHHFAAQRPHLIDTTRLVELCAHSRILLAVLCCLPLDPAQVGRLLSRSLTQPSLLPARRRQLIIRNPHLRVRMSGLSARTLEPPSLYVGTRGTQLSLRLASPPPPRSHGDPQPGSVLRPRPTHCLIARLASQRLVLQRQLVDAVWHGRTGHYGCSVVV